MHDERPALGAPDHSIFRGKRAIFDAHRLARSKRRGVAQQQRFRVIVDFEAQQLEVAGLNNSGSSLGTDKIHGLR